MVKLEMRRKRGAILQLLGVGLLGLTVLGSIVFSGIDGGIVMLVISGAVSTIGGITSFGRGTLQVARATRHLQIVNEMRQLPVARVRELKP